MDQSACCKALGFATISETRSLICTRRFPAHGHAIFRVSLNPTYMLNNPALPDYESKKPRLEKKLVLSRGVQPQPIALGILEEGVIAVLANACLGGKRLSAVGVDLCQRSLNVRRGEIDEDTVV